MSDPQEEVLDDEGKEQGFLSHLYELRDRLLRCVLSIIVLFACLFPFSEEIYTWLAAPLLGQLPEGASMIAIDVASPFLTPFKLVLMVAIFLAVPYLLSQIWGFVAPGLYKSEKRLAVPLLLSSIILFYIGVAFAYYVVFPLVFGFFTSVAPAGIEVSTDIARYLDFVITIFFAFGIAFEVPIAVFLLIAVDMTTPEDLAKKRPYFIVAAFVVGMFLTPPDVISQTLLALPMWLLFEAGIFAARFMLRKPDEQSENGTEPDPPSGGASTPSPKPGPSPVSGGSPIVTGVAASTAGKSELDDDYTELTDEEMDAEMDRIEADEEDHSDAGSDDSDDSEVGSERSLADDIAPEESKPVAVKSDDAEGGQAAQVSKKRVVAKKVTARKVTAKKVAAKKVAAKKVAAKKVTAKKVTAKKVAAKKVTAKKVTAKKITAKKITAKKITARKKKAGKKPVRARAKTASVKTGDPGDPAVKDSD